MINRKKGKKTMKAQAFRKEKKKWANFVRGMISEEEKKSPKKGKERMTHDGVDDEISEFIRNKAIKTWTVGKELGIVSKTDEDVIIGRLMESEGLTEGRRSEDVENKQNVSP